MTKPLQRHINALIKIRDKSEGKMRAQAIASLRGLLLATARAGEMGTQRSAKPPRAGSIPAPASN